MEPMEAPVVEPFKARVEAGSEFDHRTFRISAQRFRDPLIEHGGSQSAGDCPPPLIKSPEVRIDRLHNFASLGISQNRVLPSALHRASEQRNQLVSCADPSRMACLMTFSVD
jgi:hypothetical protein